MRWVLTDDVDQFRASAGEFLRSQAAANTILLTAIEAIGARGPHAYGDDQPLFGWGADPAGTVGAAFLHTPPYPVVLTEMPATAVTDLAGALAGHGRAVSGVNAAEPSARLFAAAWQAATGQPASDGRRSRLYRLTTLTPPDPPPPGEPRMATEADRALVTDWFAAFGAEAGDSEVSPEAAADDRLSYHGLTLWEVAGQPVALAGLTRMVAGQVRVGPVYTPPEMRGRGYGGAVTATVSQAGRAAGAAEVVLFTDLANATSNALYQRLGYRPVADRIVLTFAAG